MRDARPRESCGIVGVSGHRQASSLLYLGLFSLQHRGQESCGIVVSDGRAVRSHRGMGLVASVFRAETLSELKGDRGIGHVRYSTTGSSSEANIQPFGVSCGGRYLAIAHNGNLVNSAGLRVRLEKSGSIFQTTMDTEVIMHLLAKSRRPTLREKVLDVIPVLKGAFSLLIFSPNEMIAVKDPWGFRPLCVGTLSAGGLVVASESCAFDLTGARYERELKPGEVLTVSEKGVRSDLLPSQRTSRCIFEFIYFARPDSTVFGSSVYQTRRRLGERLAREVPFTGDLVVPVPDSGTIAALGFAQASGIPLEMGIIRNHYVGRTFIQPFQKSRELGVRIKLNPVREALAGKSVILVEDSLVRGTTSRLRIKAVRAAGAKKVFLALTCPPIRFPCFYGIDFPRREELAAASRSIEEIRRWLGLDGLYYLSFEGMLSAMDLPPDGFCTACFSGSYPVRPSGFMGKHQFEDHARIPRS